MKKIIFIITLLVILFSCKKEMTLDGNMLLQSKIQNQLRDSISEYDFQQLDWDHSVLIKIELEGIQILRIPFHGKSIKNDFMLLNIVNGQRFTTARIIHIEAEVETNSIQNRKGFTGGIEIFSLKRSLLLSSGISAGYLKETHSNSTSSIKAIEEPDLPIVIEFNFWSWYNIENMLYGNETGYNTTGYYSGSGGGGGNPPPNAVMAIDFEFVEDNPSIDVAKYLNCFNTIPDAGSTCTIALLTDIPVDNNTTTFFNWDNQSPGHTFLQLVKTNGSQTVKQFIGFYPVAGWKTILSPDPIPGKFADNQNHESNGSIVMSLAPDKFRSTLTYMLNLANSASYDIDENNCTDFALNVFNYPRGGHPLEIFRYNIPGGEAPFGTATPQGLYQKLVSLKAESGPESANILLPTNKTFAGTSKGPCN